MDPGVYGERFSSIVTHGFITMGIAIGHKLGLLAALRRFTVPVTSEELASDCKLKERYVREWLGCMTAANLVCITDDKRYHIPEHCKQHTEMTGFLASFLPAISSNFTDCIKSCKEDGPKGFDYSTNFDIVLWIDEEKGFIDEKWIDGNLFPAGIKEKDDIQTVLDYGCGTGRLTVMIAKYLPHAKIYGVDIDEKSIEKANQYKKTQDIPNVEFFLIADDSLDSTWTSKFDWIIIVDALHDLPNPKACTSVVKRVLKDDGVISARDPDVHSEHKMNVGNDQASMLYLISTMCCLPCSMSSEPAAANGIGWGMENKVVFLKSEGFEIIGAEDKALIHFKKST